MLARNTLPRSTPWEVARPSHTVPAGPRPAELFGPGVAQAARRTAVAKPPPARRAPRPGNAVIGIDADGHVDFVNRAAERLLGWSGDELLGKPLLALTGARSGRALAHGSLLLTALRDGKRVRLDDAELVRKDRSLLPVTCVATPRRQEGRLTGTELAFRHLSPERGEPALRAEAAPRSAPALLLNGVAFEGRLNRALDTAHREGQPVAVLALRLEQPSPDGRVTPDGGALQEAAERVRRLLRPGDSLGRIAGDELAILMPGIDVASASRVAWAIVTALGRPLAGQATPLVVHAGLALYPRDPGDTLLLNAEAALTAARRSGSGVAVYGTRVPAAGAVLVG